MIDDGLPTLTSEEQVELERKVVDIYMSAYPEGVQGYRRLQRFSLQSRRRRRRRRPLPKSRALCYGTGRHPLSHRSVANTPVTG